MNPILTIILIFDLLILSTITIFYPLLTNLISSKLIHKTTNKKSKITIIIPVLNEEKNIANKLKNLLSLYPKKLTKILVVDNGSTDKTVKIAKKFPVTILSSERGKIKAINYGLKHSKTDIVIITDADTILEKNAIKILVSSFDKGIGAVNGYAILKPSSTFYSKGKLAYHKTDWDLRYKESLIDSACSLDGKLMAFKKSIIKELPENFLCDDFLLTMLIREKGYRCIVNKDAIVYESSPLNIKEEFKQIRRRNAIGFIIVLNYLGFLFNPRYKYFGLLTFPFRRFFTFFLPLLLLYPIFYVALASFKLFLLLIPLIILSIIILNYTAIQLIGLCLLWYDLLTRNFEWRKIRT